MTNHKNRNVRRSVVNGLGNQNLKPYPDAVKALIGSLLTDTDE